MSPVAALANAAVIAMAVLLSGCMTLGAAVAVPAAAVLLPRGAPAGAADPPGTLAQPRALAGSPRVALVLGSGSMRGFAHVGVIAALEEAGIHPGLIVGTSAGSMVGALAASGLSAAQIERASGELGWTLLTDIAVPRRGIVGGERVETFVRRHVQARPIEAMPIPFAAVATDARTGEAVILNRGDTAAAVRASSSIPALFEPVSASGRMLVDGSLAAPTPVRIARRLGAQVVIAVNVAYSPSEASLYNPLDMLFQTVQIMAHNLNAAELADADVVIAPDIRRAGSVSVGNRDALIALGLEAGRDAIPAIRAATGAHGRWANGLAALPEDGGNRLRAAAESKGLK
jgi:NTE family protein